MSALSDLEIEDRLRDGSIVLTPFDSNCLNGAGYDLRSDADVVIPPGEHRLVASLERIELGGEVTATLHIRSSLARAGVLASLALVDPGFRGHLTIALFNAAKEPFILRRGERFIQSVFHSLGRAASRTYQGRYQDSQGVVERRY